MTAAQTPNAPARDPHARAIAAFVAAFSNRPTTAAAAPGRVNLIGEHTDYNDGFVLPMAINRYTVAVGALNDSATVRAVAADLGNETAEFECAHPPGPCSPAWLAYAKGVVDQFNAMGARVPGFDLAVASTVPTGSGLSSSAALEVAIATLLEELLGEPLREIEKAKLCQRAEHEAAGVPCGIMDQFISVAGREGHAMLLDCRSLKPTHAPLPKCAGVVVTHTGVSHSLADGAYAARRASCERVVAAVAQRRPGVGALRDMTPDDLQRLAIDETDLRRARHVLAENDRTRQAAGLLNAGDLAAFGRLMNDSHASLRDLYEVSCDELETLTGLARSIPGVHGSRMTGGGFGGCVVTLCDLDQAPRIAEQLAWAYTGPSGEDTLSFVATPSRGAHRLLMGNPSPRARTR